MKNINNSEISQKEQINYSNGILENLENFNEFSNLEYWIKPQQAADILGISKIALLSLLNKKRISYKLINNRRNISLQEVIIYKIYRQRTYNAKNTRKETPMNLKAKDCVA